MSEPMIIFLAGVGLALLAWAVLLLLKVNNKMTGLSEWREGHEAAHDKDEQLNKERHEENLSKFKEIFEELRHIRRGN